MKALKTSLALKGKVVLSAGFLAVVFISYLFYGGSKTPEGVYYDKYLACVGHGYWVFRKGDVFIITDESTNFITTYSKIEDHWIYRTTQTNGQPILEPGLFGIKIAITSNHSNDMYLPRHYFAWLHELTSHH